MAAAQRMAVSGLLLVFLVLTAVTSCSCFSVTAPGSALLSALRRRLHQAPAAARSSAGRTNSSSSSNSSRLCAWDASDSSCTPTHEAWLSAGPGLPSSPYRRAVLMASARDKHCAQFTSAADCAKEWKSGRCFWQGPLNATNARCASSDMEEMLLWSGKGFPTNMSIIPAAMTCPGTPAHSFFQCFAYSGRMDGCKDVQQCVLVPSLGSLKSVCIPKALQQQRLGDVRRMFEDMEGLNASVFGSCAAVCWLRQARACGNATTKQACAALPYCMYDEETARKAASGRLIAMWDDEGDAEPDGDIDVSQIGSRLLSAKALKPRTCRRKTQEFNSKNAVDRAARSIYQQCSSAQTPAACMQVTRNGTAAAAGAGGAGGGGDGKAQKAVDWKSFVQSNKSVRCG